MFLPIETKSNFVAFVFSIVVKQFLFENSLNKAIKFAVSASAITVQHLGCYAPKLEEIL